MPSLILPGEVKRGKDGHHCKVNLDALDNKRSRQVPQSDEFLGKRTIQPTVEDDQTEGGNEGDSDDEIKERILSAEDLKKYEDVTLYFGEGRKPMTIPASTLHKIVMRPRKVQENE